MNRGKTERIEEFIKDLSEEELVYLNRLIVQADVAGKKYLRNGKVQNWRTRPI